MIDLKRDEVRLAGVLERLPGRWRFAAPHPTADGEPALVDVLATNEALVLHGWRLEGFCGLSPGDPRVPRVEDLPPPAEPLRPAQIAVVLLCGGLGSRAAGKIHPLLPVAPSDTTPGRSLLDVQLARLAGSPLASAPVLVLGSLLNEAALRRYLDMLPVAQRPRLYLGGLAPRLALRQSHHAPPIIHHDPSGHPSCNPTGHFDALRWLVVSGLFAHLREVAAILVASYSNFGHVFTDVALRLAAHAAERGRQEPHRLFVVEVTARPRDKWTGSMLAARNSTPSELRLVKYSYGRGQPCLPQSDRVLMSTNTLYFSVASLIHRLRQACPSVGLSKHPAALTALLEDAAMGRRRDELRAVFDEAFPVEPLLTRKRVADGVEVLQAERDLDQLSLLPGPPAFQAVEVAAQRAVSIKLPTDLEDPLKQPYLSSPDGAPE